MDNNELLNGLQNQIDYDEKELDLEQDELNESYSDIPNNVIDLLDYVANEEQQNQENEAENEEAGEPENEENPEAEKEHFEKLSSAGKVHYLIRTNPVKNDEEYDNLFAASKAVARLFIAAKKDDATIEDKKKLALAALNMHRQMSDYLSNVQKNNPERFNNDVAIANLAIAYQYNTDVCARAIEAVGGDILDDMVNAEFRKVALIAKGEDGLFDRTKMQDSLARMLYLSKLKSEFDTVHGTEEEQKIWRSEILNELLSDKFEENIAKFKETELYKGVLAKFAGVPDFDIDEISVKERTDEAISEIASGKYHSVYGSFAYGAQTEEEKETVKKTVAEIDELRRIGEAVGNHLPEEEGKNYGNDPVFDTTYVMKRAKVYGVQENIAGELQYEKNEEAELNRRIDECEKELINRLQEEFILSWRGVRFDDPMIKSLEYMMGFEEKIEATKKNLVALNQNMSLPNSQLKEKIELEQNRYECYVNQKAYFAQKMFEETKLPSKDAVKLEEKYRRYKAEKAELEVKKTAQRAEAERIIKSNHQIVVDALKNQPQSIKNQAESYKKALEEKDYQKVRQIIGFRETDDNRYKQMNPELFRPVRNGEKDTYVSVPYEEARVKMTESYNNYKNKYGTTPEQDQKFTDSMKANDEAEKLYAHKPLPERPNRAEYKLSEFKPVPNAHQEEVELKNVPIAPGIQHYVLPANEDANPALQNQNEINPGENNVLEILNQAIAPVMEHKDVWFGTEEYKRILRQMNTLRESVENLHPDPGVCATKCREIIAAMNEYIDRKLDEKDGRRTEKTNSGLRRKAMETARMNLKNALHQFERQAGTYGNFSATDEAAYEIQAVMNLSKKHNEAAADIRTKLRNMDPDKAYRESLTAMMKYLNENVGKYRKNGGYSFRMKEDEEGRKKRIPANEEERMYKTILRAYEKVQKEYLEFVIKEYPTRLPMLKFDMTNLKGGAKVGGNPQSIYGADVHPENYTVDLTLRTPKNIEEGIDQFFKVYAVSLASAAAENAQMKLSQQGLYNPQNVIDLQKARMMTEAAFSKLYLENVRSECIKQGKETSTLNMDEVETGRQQFVSVMQKSSAYDKIRDKCYTYLDLSDVDANKAAISQTVQAKRKEIISPEQFRDVLVADVLAEELAEEINMASDMLANPAKYKKTTVSKIMEETEYNMKIAKALGINETVENKAFSKVKEGALKGKDLAECVTKIKEAVVEKQVKKVAEPVKGIKL